LEPSGVRAFLTEQRYIRLLESICPERPRLTDAEVAEIRRRRPAMRASLAREDLYLADEFEALFDQLEAERLPPDERAARIIAFHRPKRSRRRLAAE
jgi:hypothetical protein